MTVRRSVSASAAIAMITMIAIGCAACGSETASGTSATTAPGQVSRDDLALILQGTLLDPASLDAVIHACMAESGFPWFSSNPSAAAPPVADEVFVATYGYGITTTPSDVPEPDPNLRFFEGLSDAEQAAYNLALVGNTAGVDPVSDDSCLGEERRILTETSDLLASRVVENALSEFQSQLKADPSVVEAESAWSGCMNAAGLQYSARDEIIEELTQLAGQSLSDDQRLTAQQREIGIAQVDFECSKPIDAAYRAASESVRIDILDKYTPE